MHPLSVCPDRPHQVRRKREEVAWQGCCKSRRRRGSKMTVRVHYSSNSIFPLLAKLPGSPDLRVSTRRETARRPLNVRVEIEGRTDGAWTLNISRGGVRIVADVALEVGEEISLRLG